VDRAKTDKELTFMELSDPSLGYIKSVKLGSKDSKEGRHKSYVLQAESEEDLDSWIGAIRNNMVSNPVMQLINQKKRQMDMQAKKQ